MESYLEEYKERLKKLIKEREELRELGFDGASKEAFNFMKSLLEDHILTLISICGDLQQIDEIINKISKETE